MNKKIHDDFTEIIIWWNDNINIPSSEGDLVYSIHDYIKRGDYNIKFYTLVHDLTMSNEKLLSTFNSTKRNEAKNGSLSSAYSHEFIPENAIKDDLIMELVENYNSFADWKKLTRINFEMLNELNKAKKIIITKMTFNGKTAAYYVYYVCSGIARQWIKVPMNIEITSKNNSQLSALHIYKDLISFKKQGFEKYDWGGLYQENQSLDHIKGIINFKRSFGGSQVQIWKNIKVLSQKGEAAYKRYFEKRS